MDESIQNVLSGVRDAVVERPDGELTLGRRHSLWNEVAHRYPTDAPLRQAIVGYVVCNDTVAYWEGLSLEPTDYQLFYRLRALCRSMLVGELNIDEGRNQCRRLDGHIHMLDSVLAFEEQWNGVFALRAVYRACLDAIRPVTLTTPVNIEATDAEIDPDDFDPHFLTSCVVSGGATWESSSNPNLRRAFWIKWLEIVYPLAHCEASTLLDAVKS